MRRRMRLVAGSMRKRWGRDVNQVYGVPLSSRGWGRGHTAWWRGGRCEGGEGGWIRVIKRGKRRRCATKTLKP